MTCLDKIIVVSFIVALSLLCVGLYQHTSVHTITYDVVVEEANKSYNIGGSCY